MDKKTRKKVVKNVAPDKGITSVGSSRQAVEAAIDAAKASLTEPWDTAAQKSSVPPWKQQEKTEAGED